MGEVPGGILFEKPTKVIASPYVDIYRIQYVVLVKVLHSPHSESIYY